MIVADARVGPAFELESDLEIVSTTNGQFQAGILFGHRPTYESAKSPLVNRAEPRTI